MLKTMDASTSPDRDCSTISVVVVVLARKSLGGLVLWLQVTSKPGRKQPGHAEGVRDVHTSTGFEAVREVGGGGGRGRYPQHGGGCSQVG